MPLITIVPDAKPTDGGLEWSNDRETVDGGMEVYPAGGKIGPTHQEIDSLSDDDDFSDDLSLVDSDDEKRFDLNRYSPHNAIQTPKMPTVLPHILLLTTLTLTWALPQGAPNSEQVCHTMTPYHGGGIRPQGGISPYEVHPRRLGGRVMITVTSGLGIPFQGFLMQGRTPDGQVLGQFDSASINEGHPLDCHDPADSITHNSPSDKNSIEVQWAPPPGFEGPVVFK
ncbi:hypothetical protein HUJ05_012345 [Dendroctonus ponderosae]|nr:hypothetical protein HUJ05_012345 [Dendroctonus ponderosae]